MKKRLLAMVLTVAMCLSLLPVSALAAGEDATTTNGSYSNDTWSAGGTGTTTDTSGITVSKTATATTDPNVFDIELKVETLTTMSSTQAATVLVIDTSGSMNDSGKLKAAKDAAISFLDSYSGNTANAGRYLAIVQFADGAAIKQFTGQQYWIDVSGGKASNGYKKAAEVINALTATGGTNQDAGFHAAYDLMGNYATDAVKAIDKAQKNVVLLTDGKPTYHNHGTGTWGSLKDSWSNGYTSSGGTGDSTTQNTYEATIKGATTLKQVAGLYTICFGAQNETFTVSPLGLGIVNPKTIKVGEFLKDSIATTATAGKTYAYNADNATELNNAFKAIAESIGTDGKGAVVTDPMSSNVELVENSIQATGTAAAVNGTITWTLNNATLETSGNTTKYVYTLKYQVTLKEDYRDGEYHPTNGVTYLTTAGSDVINFPVPGVKAKPTRTVTFTGASDSKVYNGETQTLTQVTSDLPSGYTSNVTYSASGKDVNSDGYTGTITDVANVTIKNADSVDVTKSFKTITTTPGKLTITQKAVTMTSASDSKTYDGTALTNSTVTAEGFVTSEGATYNVTGTQTNVGSSWNTFTYTLNENTKADNYTINKVEGTLTVTKAGNTTTLSATDYNAPYDGAAHGITVTGTVAGDTLYYSLDGEDWTTIAPSRTNVQNEETIYVKAVNANYSDRTAQATITITQKPLTITADSASKTYDGTALTKNSYSITSGNLVNGQEITSVTVTGSQTEVGSSSNVPSAAVIKSDGTDVTSNYAITYANGTLTVTAPATFNPGTEQFETEDGKYTGIFVKELTGNLPSGFSETFTITLKGGMVDKETNVAAADMNCTGTVTMSAAGTEPFNCDTMTFTEAGTYRFTVTETAGTNSYIKYDDATYTLNIIVGVGDDENTADQLEIKHWYITSVGTEEVPGIEGREQVTFTNASSYSPSSNNNHTTKCTLTYETNGGSTIAATKHAKNSTVQLTAVPTRENYTFTGWYSDKDLTNKITEIKMDGNKTVYAGWEATQVPGMLNGDDHFAYVIGYPGGDVEPMGNITRAEVATIFFRLLKDDIRDGSLTSTNAFTDVNEGDWFNTAISTMAALGIVNGRTADTFAPNAPITRAEFATICARFDTSIDMGASNFTDLDGHWAKDDIEHAVTLGWIMGYEDGTFRPNNRITRAEAMTMINRVLCRMPETPEDLLSDMLTWPDNMDTSKWYYLAIQEATNSHDFKKKGEVNETWTQLTENPDWSRYQ